MKNGIKLFSALFFIYLFFIALLMIVSKSYSDWEGDELRLSNRLLSVCMSVFVCVSIKIELSQKPCVGI